MVVNGIKEISVVTSSNAIGAGGVIVSVWMSKGCKHGMDSGVSAQEQEQAEQVSSEPSKSRDCCD